MDETEAAKRFLKALKDLWKKIGIPEKVKELRREDIPALAAQADKEGNPVYPVPVIMDANELKRFYYDVLE